jgi:beta-glucanase (GH16 family)
MRRPLAWSTHFVGLLGGFVVLSNQTDASWVDPDTKQAHLTTQPLANEDNRAYELVFSDEFEQAGRKFADGSDPRWTAINKNDYTNEALHFYSHDNAHTSNGVLNITTVEKENVYKAFNEHTKQFYADKKYVQSGMLQSWNKFCFVGGIVEFSAKLPGDPHKGGLWPALWMLGNLARATYVGSSDYVWPFSYNQCNPKTRQSQEINACSLVNHYGLAPKSGRGSPEIDILEAMQGEPGDLPNTFIQRPYQSTSLQVSPGIEIDRPILGKRPHEGHWYPDLEYSSQNKSDLNPFFYGVTLVHKPNSYTYQSDALSANLQLKATHYSKQHVYRVEWEPPAEDGTGGYIKWFTDGELIYGIHGKSLDIMKTEIPSEPMYLLMNTAVSSHWGFPQPCPEGCSCKCFECGNPECACAIPSGYCDNFPASFEIDYVRVYQAINESKHILGCSPEARPTATFIEGHAKRYMTEGQRRPLEPVVTGGGSCSSHKDCGGIERGVCSASGLCECSEYSAGPLCLAHAAFYDFDTSKQPKIFSYRHIHFPSSLMVVVSLLIGGFLLSMASAVREKSKEPKYTNVNGGTSNLSFQTTGSGAGVGSYQNPDGATFTVPANQKDVTYCVIDGRLVDQDHN